MVLITLAAFGQALPEKQILEQEWKGITMGKLNTPKRQTIILGQEMKITLYNNNSIRGTLLTTYEFNNKVYKRDAKLSGTYNPATKTLTFKSGPNYQEDELNETWSWCDYTGKLGIYESTEAPGTYFLSGTFTDACGQEGQIEFQVKKP